MKYEGRDLESRLLARREIDSETGCWHYTGATTGNGYGYIRNGQEMVYAHRIAAVLFLQFDPDTGLYVLHHCDTPTCFNPEHLFVGTPRDNVRDAVAKGRMRGKKLTAADVTQIKRQLASGRTQRRVADEFGVTAAAVGQIARGQTWRNVD